MAKECPLWEPLQTKEALKAEFTKLMQADDRGLIASQYPDIAALLWVLDSSGTSALTSVEMQEVTEKLEEDLPPPQRWWDKIVSRLGGGPL
jgi:hypothetical protein